MTPEFEAASGPAQMFRSGLPGAMLQRGFWLYVWYIRVGDRRWIYVVRTGDESSSKAASPCDRFAQHLGRNERSNALARNLEKQGVEPAQIEFADFHFYWPLFREAADKDTHRTPRDIIVALEKKLADSLREVGYNLLNFVRCRRPLDEDGWAQVKDRFSEVFPQPKNSN